MNREILREYDIRGEVDRDLTNDVARDIGRAFGTYMREHGKTRASVGRDGRLSSVRLRDQVVRGMMDSGLTVTDVGLVPTPLFYFSLFTLHVDGGIMITGSHNPPEFNGFKIALGKSTIFGEEIQYLGRIIQEGRFLTGSGSYFEYPDIVEDYYGFLRKNIHLAKRFKVVIDAGNGVGGFVSVPILREMGQEVTELFCDVDGRFPNHFADPTVERNLEVMRKTVIAEKADLGIGYDGDADRIGVVDNEGNIIWGDYLMIIFARSILKAHQGAAFVSEVKCSRNLYEEIAKRGGKPIMWKAGHSLIKQKMKEEHAVLGGEMSGHMFFADRFFGFDDALYASLRLLEIMADDARPLSEYLKDLPRLYSTPEIRTDCPDRIKFDVVKRLTDHYRGQREIIDIDGVRVIFEDGWGLVRPSNTQPILVSRFEAETEEALARIQSLINGDLAKIMRDFVPPAGD